METEEFSMDVAEERGALSNAQNNLGIALKSAQRLDEAASAFNEAYRLSTNGDDKVATYQAAQILQNASQCLLSAFTMWGFSFTHQRIQALCRRSAQCKCLKAQLKHLN
ncbi:unnamed protein product [Symbiodinium necroappetens]|uniref:Uncharacterized protein n=1 Tax=Symbiodinium necroappetens TaxID=1628268 RepID=A0A812R159_9DINO|nr:unnamed protein product [Symbiodinium necroappetens]